ncbi:MAG: phosphate/phosphite/phosphonate ABC transporter substrate-binding protein [Anaerolineales bacterium]|nr:phosphate/phosphite/phosphonate ABC transporter substrate-binding protein [Anaerolineales bacterium]MCZ2123134.1 phosphate/phosphite/phosphonate ABC transporter substrate-binding protein [Anaerolineales bacterium]
MKSRFSFLVLSVFVVGSLVLSACGAPATEPPAPTATAVPPTEVPPPTATAEPAIGSPEHPIKVLFVPSVDVDFMISSGELISTALNEATGLNFEVSVPTSYAATIEEMCASPTDTIGFIPALGYVIANQLCGVEPGLASARRGWNVYWTGFYVARDSKYQTLEDLAGAKWAYPEAGSTSGYLYPASIFGDLGVKVGETIEAGGHPQSILAVYNGQADFATAYYSPPLINNGKWALGDAPDVPEDAVDSCAVNADGELWCGDYRVLDARAAVVKDAPDIIKKVRILTLSKEIPNDTMSFSPDFPEDLRAKIIEAMTAFVSLDNEACAQSLCNENFYSWTGVGPIADENFDGVRILVAQQGITLDKLGK